MPLDARITDAIREAVDEAGQPETLARRLAAWLEAIISGNEDVNDPTAAERHLDVLYKGTVVEGAVDGEDE